jgi:hypothetical protein
MRSHSARRTPTSVAVVLCASAVAWLLPATTSWAYVEVDALVEDTVVPTSRPADAGLRAATTIDLGAVSDTVRPDMAFSMIGAELPAGAGAEVRIEGPDGTWGDWLLLPGDEDHEGDDGAEDSVQAGRQVTDPVFIDHGVALQVRVTGALPEDVEVTVLDAHGRSGAPPQRIRVPASQAQAADGRPEIIGREVWGAAPPTDDINYATAEAYAPDDPDAPEPDPDAPYVDRGPAYDVLGAGVLHHTASPSQYDADEVAGIIRGAQRFHQTGRGWDDIGYNFLVDRFGRTWEGRDGGVDRAVIGAHAGGWNTTSFGVAVLGDFRYGSMPSTAALDAVVDLVAWKFAHAGIDPNGTHTWPNGGTRPTLIGHQNVRQTTCPGDMLGLIPSLRDRVAEAMLTIDVTGGPSVVVPSFGDLDPASPDTEAVLELATAGIILGCTQDAFCPDRAVTRGQIASLFAKAFELPAVEGPPPFDDVAQGSPHRDWIRALVDHGAINGFPDGTYRATIPITRVQAAAIIGRTLGIQPVEGGTFEDLQSYGSALGGWAVALTDAGVMQGCAPDRFCPTVEVTRAELATLLRNGLTYATERGLVGGV